MAKLTMTFYSDELSQKKNYEIYLCATAILDVKNEMSKIVFDDIFRFYTMSLEEFTDALTPLVLERIEEEFSLGIINDLFFSYANVFKEIYQNLYFKDDNYAKNRQFFGQLRKDNYDINNCNLPVSLAQALTYLARSNSQDVINILRRGALSKFTNRSNFCQGVLTYLDKYGVNRLMKVIDYKRNKILKGILSKPLIFNDYNFSGRSFLGGNIISPNRNTHSALKAFIQLSWRNDGIIAIPVRLNKVSVEDLKYISLCSTKIYRIRFERKGQISIVLHCEGSLSSSNEKKLNSFQRDFYTFYRSNNYSFCNFVC